MQQKSRIGLLVMAALGAVGVTTNAAGMAAIKAVQSAMNPHDWQRERGNVGSGRRNTGKSYKPNGARDCARRRRQIAAGILQVSP